MIRLKTLPAGWREKQPLRKLDQNDEDCITGTNSNKGSKSMTTMKKTPYKLKSQGYGSFEAILEWNNGTYRIKEMISL